MAYGDEQRLGSQYVLDERIGRGAMGTVWRGRDTDTGGPVAIKILAEELCEDPDVLARFVQERTVLLGIRHPNLVAVHDMVVERRRLALVMDLVSGGDLQRHLRAAGALAPAEAAGLATQICAALHAIHAAGVVHRDLKPANVLLDTTGPEPLVRLADFGVARIADRSRITARTSIVGTPSYLAPELIRGEEPVAASDVYALGITLYELLVGRPPFDGGPVLTVLHRHLEDPAERVPGIPDSLWAVIEACLGKDPAGRPDAATAGNLLLQALPGLAGLPAAAPLAPLASEGLTGGDPGQTGAAGQTGSVIYDMPQTFYGAGRSPSPQVSPVHSTPTHPTPTHQSLGQTPAQPIQQQPDLDDSTIQLAAADIRAYAPPPALGVNPPTGPRVGTPRQGEVPFGSQPTPTLGQPPAPGSFPPGPPPMQPMQSKPQPPANPSAFDSFAPSSQTPRPLAPEPFTGPMSGPTPRQRRRRTGAIAASATAVLVISGAVAIAVAANSSSASPAAKAQGQSTHPDGALGQGIIPAASVSGSPSAAATTATPTATATATPTATPHHTTATTAPGAAPTTAKSTPTPPPVVNFALHKAVTVSSTVSTSPSWAASNLTNGSFVSTSTDAGWSSAKHSSAAGTEWASVNMGSAQTVAEVNVYPRDDGHGTCFPTAFTISVSTDNVHWTTVVSESNYPAPGENTQRFTFKSVSAQYVKITATSLTADPYGNFYLQLQQISVY